MGMMYTDAMSNAMSNAQIVICVGNASMQTHAKAKVTTASTDPRPRHR